MNQTGTVFLAWQDPVGRGWFPIGRLTHDDGEYMYCYVRGAQEAARMASFKPLEAFPKLDAVYVSQTLFPLFANRILPRSRPDYDSFTEWLNIPPGEDEPIALLARSGGRKQTDTLEVFPRPIPDEEGCYHIRFFAHGLRHFPPGSAERVSKLNPGESLLLMHDFANPYDSKALMLRTNESFEGDRYLVGYCPRYLVEDILYLVNKCLDLPEVTVERVNPPPSPLQFRLMCSMTACWPEDWTPFNTELYRLIRDDVETVVQKG